MPPKKARSEKNKPKISFFTTSEKENPWSEDETDTGTTTEENEPIEVDDDVSHEASENEEQGKFIIIKSNGPSGRGMIFSNLSNSEQF
jgi:hypothetical protein